MKRDGSEKHYENLFAEIYNDVVVYPTLRSVADALGRSIKTVRNYAAILRRRAEADPTLPKIARRDVLLSGIQETAPEPEEHAQKRADALSADVTKLFQVSRYPVINPEALIIQGTLSKRYDRIAGKHLEVEGSPRTWVTDTLRVAPIDRPAGRRFIFSGAQNDTPVDQPFWRNLKAYAEAIGAELIIGPWTYETNWWDENSTSSRNYDAALEPHLCFGQLEIGENFVFCGEMNMLPTASRPLSDLTTYSRGRWAVFPHARLQLVSVPAADPAEQAFQIMTTGAVTRPRVIPRKAGIKSIFHHVLGATLVEFDDDGDIFCRQINATEEGDFQDLDALVENGLVTFGHGVEAITAADVHLAKMNSGNFLSTFGLDPVSGITRSGSLLETLRPDYLLLHDIHDHESRNHHHKDDVSHNFEMAVRGRDNVLEEVRKSANFLAALNDQTTVVVVESNHDLALERYIREGRYRMDGANLVFGLELDLAYHRSRATQAAALEAGEKPDSFSLLEWTIRQIAGTTVRDVRWVHDGKSFVLNGIQLGFHGFRGTNGAKGTVTGFARLGQKITIGDKHSPSILDGVYGAGVMQIEHGYNKGPSGWAVTHVVQYANGKRTLVTLQNGKWCARK